MSLEVCQLHNLLKDYICAKDEDNQLLCRQCFLQHSQKSSHSIAVQLSLQSKQFFLKWTEYMLKKHIEFKEILSQMGYSKVFDMKLEPKHSGSINEIDYKDLQNVALQALQERRKVIQGNLTFIQKTTTIIQMMHLQFFKDLYNIACEDTKFNLFNLLSSLKTRLIQTYPNKEIYQYTNFSIVEKELTQMEQKKAALLREYESKIILLGKGCELKLSDNRQVESDSSHQISIPQISAQNVPATQQQSSQPQQDNISTVSNPSQTITEIKQVEFSQHQIADIVNEINTEQKRSYEQLTTTIAFLKQNELMYQQKLTKLEQQNALLKSQIERLHTVNVRVKELQQQLKERQSVNNSSIIETQKAQQLQKVSIQLSSELESALRSQIEQLTKTQVTLIQENAKINKTLKDLEDVAEGRSRTISDLQGEITTLTENIKLKQRSIQQLNQLISNEEEEISYRQNEVEILGEEIKKKLQRIEFLQKSVKEHDKLVENEEQQIAYREQQVNTLNQQITKLKARISELEQSIKSLNTLITNEEEELLYRQNEVEILQKQIKKLLDKVAGLEKSIHQLNNLIANQQEEISNRENQVDTLNEQVKKLLENNHTLNLKVNDLTGKNAQLLSQVNQYSAQLLMLNQNEQKAKLLQTQLNLINQQNIQLADQVNILKKKHLLDEDEIKAEVQKNAQLQVRVKEIKHQSSLLETEVNLLKAELLNVRAELALSQQEVKQLAQNLESTKKSSNNVPAELLTQVVLLQADLQKKSNDNKILSDIVMKYGKLIPFQQSESIIKALNELKTFEVRKI